MLNIVRTVADGDFCLECYRDSKSPYDDDYSMYPADLLGAGTCVCCGETFLPALSLTSAGNSEILRPMLPYFADALAACAETNS